MPTSAGGPGGSTGAQDKPVAELLQDLSQQTATLVRHELDLAKAELTVKGKRLGVGAGLFGGAGLIAVLGLGALVAAAIAGLSVVLALWASALIVAGVLFALAGVLALTGRTEVTQASPPVPEQAVETTKEDLAWLKTQAKSARP